MIPYMIEHWYVSFLRIWQRNGILRIIWKSGKTLKKPEKSNLIFICKKLEYDSLYDRTFISDFFCEYDKEIELLELFLRCRKTFTRFI